MNIDRKSVNVKGYGNRKHEITIEKTSIGGHKFVALKKNGNVVVSCTPKEFIKLKLLFGDM